MEFNVKLERYEGPYTKLLELISDHKLSITEVSLATIADEYISFVKSIEKNSSIDISQFILVASTLMLIKARSLLPTIVFTQEEEKQVNQLEKKLELYESLRKAGNRLNTVYQKAPLFARERAKPKGVAVFVPDDHVSTSTLHSIALLTISLFKPVQKLKDIYIQQAIRIETVIENLLARVRGASMVSLSSLAGNAETILERKKTLIINFIALLELVKNGAIAVEQNEGGDILISDTAMGQMPQ